MRRDKPILFLEPGDKFEIDKDPRDGPPIVRINRTDVTIFLDSDDQLEELYGVIGQYLHQYKPAREPITLERLAAGEPYSLMVEASRAVPADVEPALDRRLRELAVPAEAATGSEETPPGWHRDGDVWRGPEGLCVAPAATIGQGWILTSHGEITIRPSERWHSTREGAIRMGAALLRDHCPEAGIDVEELIAAWNQPDEVP